MVRYFAVYWYYENGGTPQNNKKMSNTVTQGKTKIQTVINYLELYNHESQQAKGHVLFDYETDFDYETGGSRLVIWSRLGGDLAARFSISEGSIEMIEGYTYDFCITFSDRKGYALLSRTDGRINVTIW